MNKKARKKQRQNWEDNRDWWKLACVKAGIPANETKERPGQ